ncbi:AarF/UbiB family protein [Bythopirellula goksoeyrii]|uniref:AarF/UbiB family protein n=1 Tax=Bythopirellula goksoeyrii TaxID=1400387 RepID=UPI00143DFB9A|nr:AarF/UbiB family protein [Bythopirellula goksoeyrii]
MNWETIIDEQALAKLLPAEYSHFALPVKESLVVFLNGLPQRLQETILSAQFALPPTSSLSQRLGLLAHSCPVLQKLGQILARDQRLAPELRFELRKLESMPPTVSLEAIESILVEELGPLETRTIELLPPAIAEASVAVVIPFRDKSKSTQPEGVFKVLKPGIVERLHVELDMLAQVGTHLDHRLNELQIPQLDFYDTFDQVREKLLGELQLDKEQQHLASAASFYADQLDIRIPTVFEHCTPRVTAMERIYGEKVTDHQFKRSTEIRNLSELVARAMIARPILSPNKQALFHCDPHAGNLFITSDAKLAILDWSLVGFLGEVERAAIVQVMLAAISMRPTRMVATILELDVRRQCDRTALEACVAEWLRKMRRGQLPGLTWLVGMLDEAAQSARLSMSSDMLMFRKSLLTLSGVISEIGADSFNLDQVLFCEFLHNYIREWPSRWLSSFSSRAFPTRLSNLDLTEALLDSPLAISRHWRAMWQDVWDSREACTLS